MYKINILDRLSVPSYGRLSCFRGVRGAVVLVLMHDAECKT